MASVTFTTQSGTTISGKGFKSNSSFEILKSAVSLIEGVELAEEAGTADAMLEKGILTQVGASSGLLLTNNPQNIRFAGPVDPFFAGDDDEEDDEEEDDLDEEEDELIGEFLQSIFEAVIGKPATQEEDRVQFLNEAFDLVDQNMEALIEEVPYIPKDQILDEIATFTQELQEFANSLGNEGVAGICLYTLAAGLNIGAGMATIAGRNLTQETAQVAHKAAA